MRDLHGDEIIARLIDARFGQGTRTDLSTNRYPRRDQITRRAVTPNLHRRNYVADIPVERLRNED